MAPLAEPHALIVSRNARTTKGLCAYFGERGVATTVSERFQPAATHEQFTAVVVFPDEFPEQRATVGIAKLAVRFSRAWIVVVTRHTLRFEQLLVDSDVRALDRLLILPRPAWGWALLDRVLQPPTAQGET